MTPSTRPRPTLKASRAGIGVTTFALVALASAGTGILVAHGTKQLAQQPRTHATSAARAPQVPTVAPPVLVDRAPGSFALPPVARRPAAPQPAQPAPLAPVPQDLVPVDVPPAVTPPVVEPPVLEPPVFEPPVVEPPVVTPPRRPSFVPHVLRPAHEPARPHAATPAKPKASKPAHPDHPAHPATAGNGKGRGPEHDAHADNGKHNGQGRPRD